MNARQKDGATLRDHLEIVYRQTGKMPAQLEPVEVPQAILYLWGWFCELSNARQYGEFGPMPISFSEIKAWSDLTHSDPAAWEVATLKEIDRVYLSEANKK